MRDHRQTYFILCFCEGIGLCIADGKDGIEWHIESQMVIGPERLHAPPSACSFCMMHARCLCMSLPGYYRHAAVYPCTSESLSVIQGYLRCGKAVRTYRIYFVTYFGEDYVDSVESCWIQGWQLWPVEDFSLGRSSCGTTSASMSLTRFQSIVSS